MRSIRATMPFAITGAILGSTFTPTAVAMIPQFTSSSMAASVRELTARTGFTVVSCAPSLDTMRTVYCPRAFNSSMMSCMMSRKHTS